MIWRQHILTLQHNGIRKKIQLRLIRFPPGYQRNIGGNVKRDIVGRPLSIAEKMAMDVLIVLNFRCLKGKRIWLRFIQKHWTIGMKKETMGLIHIKCPQNQHCRFGSDVKKGIAGGQW